jgi:menaquinone-dependent protoporphyrinogen IX oxidase
MLKNGVTEEAANVIANVLREKYAFEVNTVNLMENKSPDISQYNNVIVGYGVRMQRPYGEGVKFLETDFKDKRGRSSSFASRQGIPRAMTRRARSTSRAC